MRFTLIVFTFFHFAAFSQFNGEWKPLPKIKSTKAIINKRPAVIDTVVSKEKAPKIQELPHTAKLEFISKVVPDTLENINYRSYPLNWTKKVPIPNGLIFKDIASHNIKYLDKSHGLPDNSISSIAEDKNGLMYLTSGSGLLVFNGSEVTIFEDHPHFSFTTAKSLFYDKNGKMWVATDERVGYIYDDRLYLPDKSIFGGVHLQPFRETKSGDFMISTNFNGLFIVKKDFILHYQEGLPHNMIADAILTSDDKLWIAFVRHGVGFIKNDSLFAYKEFGTYNNSRAFLEYDGELWIGNFAAPLLKYRNDSLFTVKLNVRTNYVYKFEQNSKGVWFSEYGRGVFLIKPNGQYYLFNNDNGLSDRNAYHLFIDSYENVWVADLLNGLSRIDENFFYKKTGHFATDKINEIETDQNGNYWHFRNGELLTKETPDEYIVYRNIPDTEFLLHAHCLDGFIRDDGVWMGSYDMGIIQLSNMEYTYHELDNQSYSDNSMFQLEHDEAGGIWTVTDSKLLLYLYNGQFYHFSDTKPWKDHVFTGIKKTSDGEIFLTTKRNGVIHIQNNRYQKIQLLETANSKQVHHVFKDLSGEFWFFMNNEIQIMKTDGSFHSIESPLFNNNPITDFIEIEKDNFLGISSNGIISIKKKSRGLEARIYDRNQGLFMVDNVSIHQNNDKVIIINHNGLIMCDSSFINIKPPPKLSFDRVEIDNDTLNVVDGAFTVEQGKQIRLVFNKIYWGNKSTLHYRLSQNNKEGSWNEQQLNTLSFQELAYGGYQLSAYAFGDNQKSNELNITFKVLPYWYQTALAKVIFVLIIVGLVVAYFLYRESQARVVKRQLEGLVQEKTSELVLQLEQKEILMQEVHHRVKNNLTFLKSLLYLRAKSTSDKESKLILDECQARIQSMAMVHQNLYDVDDATKVDFKLFLKELFVDIKGMFDQSEVEFNLETQYAMVDMKLSVFLGLIVNELITNSFKYAFLERSNKKIYIIFKDQGNQYELCYSDNGMGMTADFDIRSSTGFGFKLIHILLQQIDGKLSYKKSDLSTFKIAIPK